MTRRMLAVFALASIALTPATALATTIYLPAEIAVLAPNGTTTEYAYDVVPITDGDLRIRTSDGSS